MEIRFDENELKKIEECRSEDNCFLIPAEFKDKEYSISFKVNDPYKAEAFIANLLFNRENRDIISETTGLLFTGLNYSSPKSTEDIKSLLIDFINKL